MSLNAAPKNFYARALMLATTLSLALLQAGCQWDQWPQWAQWSQWGACTDPTSAFTCQELEEKDHSVFITFADKNNGKLLGVTRGVAACRSMAYKYAKSINLSKESGWSYLCCTKTAESECAEKHW